MAGRGVVKRQLCLSQNQMTMATCFAHVVFILPLDLENTFGFSRPGPCH